MTPSELEAELKRIEDECKAVRTKVAGLITPKNPLIGKRGNLYVNDTGSTRILDCEVIDVEQRPDGLTRIVLKHWK